MVIHVSLVTLPHHQLRLALTAASDRFLNANITCWRSGPAGTELERLVVRWLGSLISYDAQAQGLLTSGGSMANMIALLIASRRKLNASRQGLWNSGPPTVAFGKFACRFLKLLTFSDSDAIRCVWLRAMITSECASTRSDKRSRLTFAKGLRLFCVVASAGTVNTGVVDPTRRIANVAKVRSLVSRRWCVWRRVFGRAKETSLPRTGARRFSFTRSAQKWLYVPVDAGCLYSVIRAAAGAAFNTKTPTTSRRTDTVMKKRSPLGLRC